MKRHIILYIVLVLLLAACGPTPSLPQRGGGNDAVATQLALIDSIADVNPGESEVTRYSNFSSKARYSDVLMEAPNF